jgi:RHS repeat-associated protein
VGVERIGTVECDGNGTSVPGTRTQRDYFPLTGKLKSTKTRCGDTIIQDLSYQYDLAGNMTRRENAVGTTPPEVFGYDALNRPGTMNGDDIHYFNNDFGSLHSTAALGLYEYQGGGGDWIASAGDNSFDQDAVGNVIQRQGPDIPGQIQTIDYTSFDLPSSITGGPAGATFTVDFSYDADKKRVVKRKQSAQTPTTTTFYADSLYQRVETEGAPTRHRSMIYANGRAVAEYFVDEGISGPPRIRYLYHDALGSIKTITDSNGTNPITREYAPFGLRTSSTSSDDLPYGFTGHEEDMELGLVNMKGRMYDPVIGQFLTADPVRANIFSVQGLNRFAYVENSPLNFIDPSGFILEDVLDVGGRVVEAAVLSYAGGSLAGQYGGQSAYMSKDYMKFHGSLNGALSGARQIYSLDGEGFRSFYLDSTNGIHGTALGNYVNVFNTSLEASGVRGTDNNWTTRFSPGLSERENRHVFFGGFRLAPGYAHTQGNVVSNFRGSDDLMSHEQEHVMTSRVFGLSYQATYYSWFIGGAAIGLGQSIYETLDIAATEGRLEFDWKKAESNIRSKGYRSNPWEMHAYCAHNRSDWDRENNPFCQ